MGKNGIKIDNPATVQRDAERKRLAKADGDVLVTAFEKLENVTAFLRGGKVVLFRGGVYIGSVCWRAKLGWEPVFVQPLLLSHHDIDLAVAELDLTLKAQGNAHESWKEFLRKRTHKAWNHYVGILAAYCARIFTPSEDDE